MTARMNSTSSAILIALFGYRPAMDPVLQGFMSGSKYIPYGNNGKDDTFTGEIRPMKLVFFDLQPNIAQLDDSSSYSQPLVASADALAHAPRTVGPNDLYYNNKIMNYYGDSFHVTPRETPAVFDYAWNYEDASDSRVVVNVPRVNAELNKKKYQPMQIALEVGVTHLDLVTAISRFGGRGEQLRELVIRKMEIQAARVHRTRCALRPEHLPKRQVHGFRK